MKIRSFSVSATSFGRHPSIEAFRYWEGFDWDRVMTHYAVIDPVDPKGVLYLTEREYTSMLKVALSTETAILVIARPGDEPPQDYHEKVTKDLSKISPLTKAQILSSKFWRSTLSRYQVQDSNMVEVDSERIVRLVSSYSILVASYSGVKLGLTMKNSIRHFATYSSCYIKSSGINAYILRLKLTKLALELYLAGSRIDTRDLGQSLRLSKGGLPTWLPLQARQAFLNRSIVHIRFWMSLLNIYRALLGVYPAPTYSSISDIFTPDVSKSLPFENFLRDFSKVFGFSVPQDKLKPVTFPLLLTGSGVLGGPSILSAHVAARLWGYQRVNSIRRWMKHFEDTRGLRIYNTVYALMRPWADFYRPRFLAKSILLGKLHLKYEAAGKVRVFAMADYWTQYCLLPLHKSLFSLLEKFNDCDATFDQDTAVSSFSGHSEYYSYDLKSATDLIPRYLYKVMLDIIYGKPIGDYWETMVADRDFKLPDESKGKPYVHEGKTFVRYGRGQPMGILSSWASLALLHHFLVQFANYQESGEIQMFDKYRVLGDDIVIADTKVARNYLQICQDLDIPISLAKSVISPPSSIEGKKGWRLFQFANQIVLGPVNISPLSLKEEISSQTFSARLELVTRLVGRGWSSPKLSFYLKALLPIHWKRAQHAMSKGHRPLFMDALLPLLLSPMTKNIGITGLSKYYAWFQVLSGSYNFADLLNHRFWNSEKQASSKEKFVAFLSERARDIYRDILTQQDWGNLEGETKRISDFLAFPPKFFEWYAPFVEDYLVKTPFTEELPDLVSLETSGEGRLTHIANPAQAYFWDPDKDITEGWISPKYPLSKDSPEKLAWLAYRESALPLLHFEEKGKTRTINVNLLNYILVREALSDYLVTLKETISPLLKMPAKRKAREHDYIPDIFVFSVPKGESQPRGSWIPRADAIPRGKVFALLTDSEHKMKAFDQDWDQQSPLVPCVRDPISLPVTFERLENLVFIQRIYTRLKPEDLLRRFEYDSKPTSQNKIRLQNKFLTSLLVSLRKSGLKSHLFKVREEIVPCLPGV